MIQKSHPAVVLGMFEAGLAVGRSLGRQGIAVTGFDFKRDIGFYSKYIKALICPHPLQEEESFLDCLVKYAERQEMKPVLFITSDYFLISVSRNRDLLLRYFLMNLPDRETVDAVTDKFSQYRLAVNAGIPLPKTFFPSNMDEVRAAGNNLTFPAFVKGREVTSWRKNISGQVKGFPVSNERELISTFTMLFEKKVDALVQEVIRGPDTNHFKVCCYISQDGRVLLAFTLQKIRQEPIRFGVGSVVESIHDPGLMELGKKFFAGINYRGVGSAEFKRDERDGILKLIELNPRYWQQNALTEHCGMNFPVTDYLEVTGQRPGPVDSFIPGIKWVNIYMDISSFLEYRRAGEITVNKWLKSLRGRKVYSDFAADDMLPGFYEIRFGKRLLNIPGYIFRKVRSGGK